MLVFRNAGMLRAIFTTRGQQVQPWFQACRPCTTAAAATRQTHQPSSTAPKCPPSGRPSPDAHASSVDAAEVAKFNRQAGRWWDPSGSAAPLHRLNPVRIAFIRAAIERRLAALDVVPQASENVGEGDASPPRRGRKPLTGAAIVDVGCGGGLVAEPLARLGADVLGVDMASEAIAVASTHAALDPALVADARLRYEVKAVEELVAERQSFDAVLALEIIEHVSAPEEFLKNCAELVRPGGLLVVSTLNRTAASYALGVVAAERVLRWLPEGTHDWTRFPTPGEVAECLEIDCGMVSDELSGLSFDVLRNSFYLSHDCSVNYILTAYKPMPGE